MKKRSRQRNPAAVLSGIDYIERSADGTRLAINLDRLPAPDRVYVASAFRVDEIVPSSGTFGLSFGQLISPRRLASLVTVQMESSAVVDFCRSCTNGFLTSLERLSTGTGEGLRIHDYEVAAIELSRVWPSKATLVRGCVSLNGAQIDFFELSPRNIVKIHRDEDPDPVPGVITIFCSARLLLELVKECMRLVKFEEPPSDTVDTTCPAEEQR